MALSTSEREFGSKLFLSKDSRKDEEKPQRRFRSKEIKKRDNHQLCPFKCFREQSN